MRRIIVSACLAGALPASAILPAPAAAATTTQRYHFSGGRVQAILDTVDATGCVIHSFYFDAIVGTVKESRRPEASSMLAVNVLTFNRCTRESQPAMFGIVESLPASAMQIDRQLDGATLATTITVADFNGNEATVAMDIAFTGYGPLVYRALDRSTFKTGYLFSRSYGRLENRDAMPAGTVTLNGQELPLQPGFCRGGGGCSSLHWVLEGSLLLDFSPNPEAWGITATASSPSIAIEPAGASASPSRVTARSLLASVQRVDPPCVNTLVDVSATTLDDMSTGPPVHSLDIEVAVSYFDFCTFEELLLARSQFRAPVPSDTVLEVAQSLASARIQAAVPVFEFYTGELVGVVAADLAMTATEHVSQRGTEMLIFTGSSGSLDRATGVAREAAVSGTVTVGSLALVATPETSGAWLTGWTEMRLGR